MRGARFRRLYIAVLAVLALVAVVGGAINSLALVGVALGLSIGAVGLAAVTLLQRFEARDAEQTELRRDVASVVAEIAQLQTASGRIVASLDRLVQDDAARLDAIREHVAETTSRSASSLREHVDR